MTRYGRHRARPYLVLAISLLVTLGVGIGVLRNLEGHNPAEPMLAYAWALVSLSIGVLLSFALFSFSNQRTRLQSGYDQKTDQLRQALQTQAHLEAQLDEHRIKLKELIS